MKGTEVRSPADGGTVATDGNARLTWPDFWYDPIVRSPRKRSVLAGTATASMDVVVSALNGGTMLSRETANAPFKVWVRFGEPKHGIIHDWRRFRADAYVITLPDGCVYDEHGAIYRVVAAKGSSIEIRENFMLKTDGESVWCRRAAIVPIRWGAEGDVHDGVFLFRMHKDPPGIVRISLLSEACVFETPDGELLVMADGSPGLKRLFTYEEVRGEEGGEAPLRLGGGWWMAFPVIRASMQTFCLLFTYSKRADDIITELADRGQVHWAENTVFEPLFRGISKFGTTFAVPVLGPSAYVGVPPAGGEVYDNYASKPGRIGDQAGAIRIVANCTVDRAQGVRACVTKRLDGGFDVSVDLGSVAPLYGNIPVISTESVDPVTGGTHPKYRGFLSRALSADDVRDGGILSLALVGKPSVHPDDFKTPVYDVELRTQAEIEAAADLGNTDVWDATPGASSIRIPILAFSSSAENLDFDAIRKKAGRPELGSRTAIALLDSHDTGSDMNMWKPVECILTRAADTARPGWKDLVFYSASDKSPDGEEGLRAKANAFLEALAREMAGHEVTNVLIRAHGIVNVSGGGSSSLYGGTVTGARIASVIHGVATADPSRDFRVFVMLDACYAADFLPEGLVLPGNAHVLVLSASLPGSASKFSLSREVSSPGWFDSTCRFMSSLFCQTNPFRPHGPVTGISTTFLTGISKWLADAKAGKSYDSLCSYVKRYTEWYTDIGNWETNGRETTRLYGNQGAPRMTAVVAAFGGWTAADFRRPAFT